MKKHISATGIALLLLSLLLCIGTATFLHPCSHDDGTVSVCHWAGQMLIGIGAVLTLQATSLLMFKSAQARSAMALSMLPVSVLAMLTSGKLIPLCMMASMRCNSVMKPSVRLLSALILVLSVLIAAWSGLCARKEAKGDA